MMHSLLYLNCFGVKPNRIVKSRKRHRTLYYSYIDSFLGFGLSQSYHALLVPVIIQGVGMSCILTGGMKVLGISSLLFTDYRTGCIIKVLLVSAVLTAAGKL